MTHLSSSLRVGASLLLVLSACSAQADVFAVDTLTGAASKSSGDWFGHRVAEGSEGPIDDNYVVAYRFMSQASGVMSKLEANLRTYSVRGIPDTSGQITLALYADAVGEVGTFLRPLTLSLDGEPFDGSPLAQAEFSNGQLLEAGKAYWLVTPLVSIEGDWYATTAPMPEGTALQLSYGEGMQGSMNFTAKFDGAQMRWPFGLRVGVSPVPEASPLASSFIGLFAVGLALRGRKSRRLIPPRLNH